MAYRTSVEPVSGLDQPPVRPGPPINEPSERWLGVGSALVIAVLLISSGLGYQSLRLLRENASSVGHAHDVLEALGDLLSTVKDAETGERGFLITGDSAYLVPYQNAIGTLAPKLDRVRQLTRDNPPEQSHLPRLQALIQAKLDELAKTISLRKDKGPAAAQIEVITHLGRNRMAEIRSELRLMQDYEAAVLRARQVVSDRAYRDALIRGGLSAAGGLAAVLALIWFGARYGRRERDAATALFRQREEFRTTLASIGDAVITTDTAGRVTYLNPVAESLTEWTLEEARHAPLPTVFNIFNEETRQAAENPIAKVLATGLIVGLANHTVLVGKRGTLRPIDDSAAPIKDADGQVVGVVLVFRDISARRLAEHAVRDADRRKDEFLATLAHELRNPLAPIRNAANILQAKGPAVPELAWCRDVIDRQVQQMARLLDDLLDVSRISRNRLELRRERVPLAEVIDLAVETAGPMIDTKRHQLIVTLPPEPIEVEADPTRLAQVFANLLNNAAKFTDDGGNLSLHAERQGSDAVVSVADTGVGIAEDFLPHIFDMFAQAKQPLERAQSGLGIGLSLVSGIVELHGGTIQAKSRGPGLGAEFTVRIPAVIGSPKPPPAVTVDVSHSGLETKRRLLIADDLKDSADSLAALLRMMGHEVATAYDGEEAVKTAAQFQPDAVLLDIGMPKVNGYEACRQIRVAPWGRKMVVVALTGWGQASDRRTAEEAGFDFHLLKPVSPAELLELLADRKSDPPGA